MLLSGEFDIHIINACNLSCKRCSILDFSFQGEEKGVINKFTTYEDVVKQVELIKDWGYQLETLKILGGEPTTHPKFPEIVDYLVDSQVAKRVWVNTNALNMTEKVIKACSKLDKVLISVYPLVDINVNQLKLWKESGMAKEFNKTHITLIDAFECYGEGQPHIEYSQKLNWERCWQKFNCRVIEGDQLYQCSVAYGEKAEGMHISEWGTKLGTMLDLCARCPFPPKYKKWESLKPTKDKRNLAKGVKLWNEYKNKINFREI